MGIFTVSWFDKLLKGFDTKKHCIEYFGTYLKHSNECKFDCSCFETEGKNKIDLTKAKSKCC